MKSREDKNMISAYKELYTNWEGLRHKPKLHIFDNKCNKCIKPFLKKKGTKRHHVAPDNQGVNAAGPAVKTTTYHAIAALATLDWSYPIQLWSKTIKQFQDTLTMFRTSRLDTAKTAYQETEGEFDWNATPLAPLGTRELVFAHLDNRNSFAPRCDTGYVVYYPPHHRLMEFYIPAKQGYRRSGTYRLLVTLPNANHVEGGQHIRGGGGPGTRNEEKITVVSKR